MRKPNPKYFGSESEIDEIAVKYLNGEPLTLDETSKVMGVSRSAVKAIEVRALAKLKKAFAKYGIKRLDDVLDCSRGRYAVDSNGSGLE